MLFQIAAGTEYVVMECIVMEGEDDHTLEPGETVCLVNDTLADTPLIHVRTTDDSKLEGKIATNYLRRRTSLKGAAMESKPHPLRWPPLIFSVFHS